MAKCNSCTHEAACAAWVRHGKTLYDDFEYSVDDCPHYAPTVEVVHGQWVGETNMRLNLPQLSAYDDWHCSVCDWVYPERYIGRLSNYCPHCGTRMGKEVSDGA